MKAKCMCGSPVFTFDLLVVGDVKDQKVELLFVCPHCDRTFEGFIPVTEGERPIEKAGLVASRERRLEVALCDLLAQIELHTDCMDGRISITSLDDQVAAAENLVGSWPDFSPPGQIVNPIQSGIDRTTSGAIGQS